jgi:RHS repeat-associated protein
MRTKAITSTKAIFRNRFCPCECENAYRTPVIHDPERQRFQQTAPGGTTLYLGGAEKFTGSGGAVRWTNYLTAAGGLVGMHVENSDETTSTRYFHKDHLGSIAVITDEAGAVVERLSYDAWGKRRNADGTDDPAGSITSQTNRAFTGHEELDSVGLVQMNGRVYDPLLARFGTVDPSVVCQASLRVEGAAPAHWLLA